MLPPDLNLFFFPDELKCCLKLSLLHQRATQRAKRDRNSMKGHSLKWLVTNSILMSRKQISYESFLVFFQKEYLDPRCLFLTCSVAIDSSSELPSLRNFIQFSVTASNFSLIASNGWELPKSVNFMKVLSLGNVSLLQARVIRNYKTGEDKRLWVVCLGICFSPSLLDPPCKLKHPWKVVKFICCFYFYFIC